MKAIAISIITVGCLVALAKGIDFFSIFTIGFLGVWAIDELT